MEKRSLRGRYVGEGAGDLIGMSVAFTTRDGLADVVVELNIVAFLARSHQECSGFGGLLPDSLNRSKKLGSP